jgi:predicted permease
MDPTSQGATWQDARFAWRSVWFRPGRTLLLCGILSLAVGIVASMFGVIDAVVLRPIPFKHSERLARVYLAGPTGNSQLVSPAVFQAWRRCPIFEDVEAAVPDTALIGRKAPETTVEIARVTAGVFDLVGGTRPIRGRLFQPAAERFGDTGHVLISERIWRTVFEANDSVIGSQVFLDDKPVTVDGILPADFYFPESNTTVWKLTDFSNTSAVSTDEVSSTWPLAFVRFVPNVPQAQALTLATATAKEADSSVGALSAHADPLVTVAASSRRAAGLLMSGVAIIFLVLCGNASGVLLAGMVDRRHELAIRSAIGATRLRLVRQALFEGAICGLAAALGGALIADAIVSVTGAVVSSSVLPRGLAPLAMNTRVGFAAALAGILAVLGASAFPAVFGTRAETIGTPVDLAQARATPRRGVVGRFLLVSQIALSAALLFCASLLTRSFISLNGQDRGFDTRNILVAMVDLPTAFSSPEGRLSAMGSLEAQLRALPGVTLTTWSYGLPPGGGVKLSGLWQSDAAGRPPVMSTVDQYFVSRGYFALYGIPVLSGRPFQDRETPGNVLVSERFAALLWPGSAAAGRHFAFSNHIFNVLGVTRELRFPSVDQSRDVPQFYSLIDKPPFTPMISMRCKNVCPEPLLIRQVLFRALPGIKVTRAAALADVYTAELARPRAALALAIMFAILAVIASTAGLYGVISRDVSRRCREFGVRAALGASPTAIRRMIWGHSLALSGAGLGVGLLLGLTIGRQLTPLLFHVSSTDVGSLCSVAGILLVASTAASWRPAHVATGSRALDFLRDST